jgi:hypothetical protein
MTEIGKRVYFIRIPIAWEPEDTEQGVSIGFVAVVAMRVFDILQGILTNRWMSFEIRCAEEKLPLQDEQCFKC